MNSEEATRAWGKLGESFRRIQDYIFTTSPSSSSSTTAEDIPQWQDQVTLINENVYELYAPTDDDINVEIVFVRGLQRKENHHPHITTWLTRTEPVEIWPKTWLGQSQFSQARILSVSYDTLDLYREAENLVSTLVRTAKVGQRWGCPVVMVGHCLGGLLIKRLCVFLSNFSSYDKEAESFVENVRGVFFLATPHQGFCVSGIASLKPNPLWKESENLDEDMARLNGDFERLRNQKKWRIGAIGESNQTKTNSGNLMHAMMVPEASARHCSDLFYTAHADHFDICKPVNEKDSTFQILVNFIRQRIAEGPPMRQEHFTLPKHRGESLEIRAKEVERRLQDEERLAIVGMGGIGKTSLAKAVFNAISHHFEFTCFVENIKDELKKLGSGRRADDLLMENLRWRGKKMEPLECRGFQRIVQGNILLLVLDDVDSSEQMDVIPEPQWLANQSRVIVTSRIRSKEIFPYPEFSLYDARLLKDVEAHLLFCNHASNFGEMPRELVKKVVDKCAGLPLTIQVIGSYLGSEMSKDVWERALDRLSHAESLDGSAEDKLWGKLTVSFDALSPLDQGLFLDCACLFAGYDYSLSSIKAQWSILGWKNLLDRCLVTEICLSKINETEVFPGSRSIGMHEQLRDMGRSLAADTRIGESPRQTLELLTNDDPDHRLNLIEGLRVLYERYTQPKGATNVEVRCSTLASMSKLRFLQLQNVDVRGNGPAFPPKLAHLEWIHSFRLVPRVFSIRGYPQRSWLLHDNDLPNLENLAALCISNVSIGVRLPKKFGKLRNLKVLELVTPKLTSLPDSFCELSSLETLFIGSAQLRCLPDSVWRAQIPLTTGFVSM